MDWPPKNSNLVPFIFQSFSQGDEYGKRLTGLIKPSSFNNEGILEVISYWLNGFETLIC
jgi:hypothetical protein